VLARLVKNLEKTKRDLMGSGGSASDSKEVALIEEIILGVRAFLHILAWCIAIYNAMSATVEAVDNPDVPPATKEQLNNNLSELVESASNLGCP
jgi:hypothetical protein